MLHDREAVHTRIALAYIELLQTRVAEPAFHPSAEQRVIDVDPRVLAIARIGGEPSSGVLCLINVSSDEVNLEIEMSRTGMAPGLLTDLIGENSVDAGDGTARVDLAAYGMCWLKGKAG